MPSHYQHTYRLTLTYFSFRILLALALFAVSFVDMQVDLNGSYESREFIATVAAFFVLAVGTQVYALLKHRALKHLALLLAIVSDVIFCLLCMHFSGGFGTGLAILLLSPVAIAGIFFYGVFAFFIAAISSIGLLAHIAWSSIGMPDQAKYFVPAGLLGMLFFACSLATQLIARYIRKTEILADEQQDLAEKLAKTNLLIVRRMQTGILVLDKQQIIQTINNSANQLLGKHYQPGDALNGKLQQIFQQWRDTPDTFIQSFQESPGLPTLKASFAPVHAGTEETIIFLENQSTLAQQAQHMKLASLGRLSASIAHEIRNPLSAINHASQLLAESEHLDTADKRLLQMIENQAARLNNIVGNVLSISRRTAANPQKVDVQQCIARIVTQLQETRSINIATDLVFESHPFVVPFDESQLQQVLSNLIDNAVLHSAKAVDDHWVGIKGYSKDNRPCIAVYDKGHGIKPDDIEKVFEPFYTTNAAGTGLGLYISRELCEMNQAVLDYIYDENGTGFFQIHFAHINRRQTITE